MNFWIHHYGITMEKMSRSTVGYKMKINVQNTFYYHLYCAIISWNLLYVVETLHHGCTKHFNNKEGHSWGWLIPPMRKTICWKIESSNNSQLWVESSSSKCPSVRTLNLLEFLLNSFNIAHRTSLKYREHHKFFFDRVIFRPFSAIKNGQKNLKKSLKILKNR